MSRRSRFFEYLPYRHIIRDLWKKDKNMLWKAVPKPSMDNDCFRSEFWDEQKPGPVYSLTEKEPIFEAADIIRCGKHLFIQEGMSTNKAAIEWLRREFNELVFNECHFYNDLWPNHMDATLIPLRPPIDGDGGLVLVNPEKPMWESEAKIWIKNGILCFR